MTQLPGITTKSWLMVAALGLIWGGTFMVQKLALGYLPPLWVAAGRISFAAVLTVALWQALGGRLFTSDTRDWRALGLVALLSVAVPFMLLSWAQQYVTSGFTGVSMAAVALITLPLAHLFIPGERMTLRRATGFVIGWTPPKRLSESVTVSLTSCDWWCRAKAHSALRMHCEATSRFLGSKSTCRFC